MRKHLLLLLAAVGVASTSWAQPDRWQQRVKYSMDINVDVTTNRFTGKQQLEYTNNSPDTLKRVFYHLYWNAFQPNSMMDARSRELGKTLIGGRPDWDGRVTNRIEKLQPDEIGYQKIKSLTMNGVAQKWTVHETILEVVLSKPILPRAKVVFDMQFDAQVPLQVRRAGRDNPNTGVRYSMSQWYPKMAEYDYEGWHADPYVAREFYGIWGDFDVKITIDKNYLIGGTGYLQNASQVGHGYEGAGIKVVKPTGNTLTWHFSAPNVHDFMWAADPHFKHLTRTIPNGPAIHVLYNRDLDHLKNLFDKMASGERARFANNFDKYLNDWDERWKTIADAAVIVLPFIEKKYGDYPYKQYSFIHGGDGGMEYPMSTLLSGPSLGTAFHEWMHSWYQGVLATNESQYAWMDEGFTSYADVLVAKYYYAVTKVMAEQGETGTGPRRQKLADSVLKSSGYADYDAHEGSYSSYIGLARSGLEEPLTTHADHFETNFAYSSAAYSKGHVFMEQLGYIIGAPARDKVLLEYYRLWKFKHPNVNDFMRIAENVSGLELSWYQEYFVNTTKTINYAIDSLWEEGGKTKIRLKRIGKMPMPIDLQLEWKDGTKEIAYIPMYLMFGGKQPEGNIAVTNYEAWKWTHPTYVVEMNRKLTDLKTIEIDPSKRMADIDRSNNKLEIKW